MLISKIKSLSKSKSVQDLASYTTINFLEKFLPFLVLPILTNNLSIEDVGLYVIYQTLIEILKPIMTINIDNAILINYYKLEKGKFKKYFSSALILFGFFFFFILFVIIIFRDPISSLVKFPAIWLIFVCITVFFSFFAQNRQNLWRITFDIKKFRKFTLGISVVKNVVGILLVFYSGLGWKGMIVGHLFGYSLFGTYAFISFYKEDLIQRSADALFIKDILKVSIPIAIHRFGIWLGSAGNKIIIASLIGTAATGTYGVVAVFAAVIAILEDALSKAIIPHIYEKLKQNTCKQNKLIVKMSYGIYLILILVSIVVYFSGYYLMDYIFGKQLNETKLLLLPLIIAALFKGFYKLHVHYIFFTKKTLQVTKITLFTGVLNVGLSYFLVSNYGIIGAAYSLVIINFIQYVLSFKIGNKLVPMPWFKYL
jgi:O-antigen/teichoic acid export membrane protein